MTYRPFTLVDSSRDRGLKVKGINFSVTLSWSPDSYQKETNHKLSFIIGQLLVTKDKGRFTLVTFIYIKPLSKAVIMSDAKYNCPVEVTLEVIGGKWKCVILWWLRRDAKRFGELKQLIPRITQKILTEQLRELEADGLILRKVFREAPPRVEYSLTPYGETICPITQLMCEWGKNHMSDYHFGMFTGIDGLQVLVVDEQADTRELLRTILEERGAQAIAVASTQQAISVLREIQPNIIVSNIGITSEDTYNLIRHVRSQPSQGGNIPAIALTESDRERRQALMAGFQVHLAKPVEPTELVAAIASLTGRLA